MGEGGTKHFLRAELAPKTWGRWWVKSGGRAVLGHLGMGFRVALPGRCRLGWEQGGTGGGGVCVWGGRVSPGQAPSESLLTRRPGAVGAQAGLAAGS